MKLSEDQLRTIIQEVIRKVQGGWKVYPKKPRKGQKRRKALSKKPHKTYKAALAQLRAVERSKSLKENYSAYTSSEVGDAVDRALEILDIKSDVLKNFMLRIARTESGGSPEGVANSFTHHKANPFQLDPPAVENVKTNVNMRRWRSFVDDKKSPKSANLSQKIEAQSYKEVVSNKTLSALFATMYVLWFSKFYFPDNRSKYDYASKIGSDVKSQAKVWKNKYNTVSGKGKESDFITKNSSILKEGDPPKGTGKKPKGSGRRLYTDEDPSDTVAVEFKSAAAIKRTLRKKSFKSKSHQRQSQIINLIHQRARAAYKNAKDPKTKARLKRAYEYAESRKEASKRKTQRMRKKK